MTRRIVLDAAVLASGLMQPAGECGSLLRRWLVDGSFEVVVSRDIMAEVEAVLHQPDIQEHLGSAHAADRLAAALGVLATWVNERGPAGERGAAGARGRSDEMYLRAAAASATRVVVSIVPELLARPPAARVEIVSPATYLEVLELA